MIYQAIGDKAGVGATLHYIGYVYYNKKEYEQALDYFQQALPIQREVDDGDEQRETFNLMGKTYDEYGDQLVEQNQYREALEKFQQLLVINRKLAQKEWEGLTLNQLGSAYTNLGEYELALDFYQQALAIPPPYWTPYRAAMLSNTGRLYQALGQYKLALKFYQEALEIARIPVFIVFDDRDKIGDIPGEVRSLNSIAGIHSKLENYELALKFYQKSLAVLKTVDNKTYKKKSGSNNTS